MNYFTTQPNLKLYVLMMKSDRTLPDGSKAQTFHTCEIDAEEILKKDVKSFVSDCDYLNSYIEDFYKLYEIDETNVCVVPDCEIAQALVDLHSSDIAWDDLEPNIRQFLEECGWDQNDYEGDE
jgi:hypothetical protein